MTVSSRGSKRDTQSGQSSKYENKKVKTYPKATQSILEKMDGESSYDDEVDPVTKAKIMEKELFDLDQKYLLDDDKLGEDNVFMNRVNKNSKNKERNGNPLQAFQSIFIPPKSAGSEQTRNISSATSNNASTVIEEP